MKKLIWQVPLLLFLIGGTLYISHQEHTKTFRHISGKVFGTSYHITYCAAEDLQSQIETELQRVDESLSMFNDSSTISRVNRGELSDVGSDGLFIEVFRLARRISEETGGAFDITVAPLVNAWGFGFKNDTEPTPSAIDSILAFVGYTSVSLDGPQLRRQDSRTMLDCSAIAKGYGTDRVAHCLQQHGVSDFMVEIGGEIVVGGKNEQGKPWRIGINTPTEEPQQGNGELQGVLEMPLPNSPAPHLHASSLSALATSGNYRNFYYKDGQRYAHTIDPKTGRPVQHSTLSVTVVASTCAEADAYATSFMVMPPDNVYAFLQRHPELKVYLISASPDGGYDTWCSPGMEVKP